MSDTNENDVPQQAAIRIARLIHHTLEKIPLSEQEQQELEKWLSSSDANAATMAALQDRKLVANELEVLLQYDEEKAVTHIFSTIGRRPPSVVVKWRTMIRRVAVAASLLVLTGLGWWFFVRPGASKQQGFNSAYAGLYKAVLTLADGRTVALDSLHTPVIDKQGGAQVAQQHDRITYTATGTGTLAYNTLSTPRGGQYALQLADGSEVWLNVGSSITYPTAFAGDRREVTLTGEAYFKVTKDSTKPFFVTAGDMKVQVIGTEFNIMAYSDETTVRTTLAEGVVKAGHTSNQRKEQLVLQPGEQAILVPRSGVLSKEKVDLADVTGWRLGQLSFHATNMPAIMRQIARWYAVNIEYRGNVDNIRFDGQLSKKEKVKDLLDILSDTRNVHFEIKDDTTIVVIPGPR